MLDQSTDDASTAPTGIAEAAAELTDLEELEDLTDLEPDAATDDTRLAAPRPRADLVALAVAITLPLVGTLLTLVGRTWLTVAFLVLLPVVGVVYGLGVLAFVKALRRRSMLRRELGAVPTRYRVHAWVWALAFLLSALSPMLGGFDLPWALQAGLVGGSAVVAGVVTGAVWSTYMRDVAWIESQH